VSAPSSWKGEPTTRSGTPSPSTLPALATDRPNRSPVAMPAFFQIRPLSRPENTYTRPLFPFQFGAPTTKSSTSSPLMSPTRATAAPNASRSSSPTRSPSL
jgi:hypothetical protein